MKKYFWILILGLLGCNSIPKEVNEETIFDSKTADSRQVVANYKRIEKEINDVRKINKQRLELYIQQDSGGLIKKVPNFNDTPESYYSAYNLIRDKEGQIIFIGEYPGSESGDWNLTYENFFDQRGNLLTFVRECSFFNGQCADIVRERSEYFYNLRHELIQKTYKITDGENKPIRDSKKCEINYRFDYKKYMTLTEYLKEHRFDK